MHDLFSSFPLNRLQI